MARIIIIEDEPFILAFAESVLREAGHETTSAQSLAEAHALVHSPDHFDLVFTDVVLQDHEYGGVIVAMLAVERRPGIQVLYTSGTEHPPTDGAKFLPKPYTAKSLLDLVDDLLQRKP